ncbi:hypothetical protein [Hymenobacter sp.]|jgi:hypothetical protein|uniref:hypothetical protein n=1 Tax=Hymenobacter sp. TaxID=1898978 RepID=UPI002ED88436
MALVAFRSEYQITVDADCNRVTYERFEELSMATDLPYFLDDWQRALSYIKPNFTVLIDLRRRIGPNVWLMPIYLELHYLLLEAGVGIVAEVHPTVFNMSQISRTLREQTKLPVQLFIDRAEAEAFLDSFRMGSAA